jgi:hypothetical protein
VTARLTARLTDRRTAQWNAGKCLCHLGADGRGSLCDRLILEGLKVRQAVHTSSSQVYKREDAGQRHDAVAADSLNSDSNPKIPQISRSRSCVASPREGARVEGGYTRRRTCTRDAVRKGVPFSPVQTCLGQVPRAGLHFRARENV